ncbi:nociceptin receptor-like [Watersipora subatra]|uniref:nociceptin receptor-like n=1 Tax=Watersipora subatra TaxID=2589382 RepID=UPI00355AF823
MEIMTFTAEGFRQLEWRPANVSCDDSLKKQMCDELQNVYETTNRIERISLLDFSSSGWIWAGALLYGPLCIFGILGNLLTLILFCKYLQKTTTSIYIIALAIVDLVICMTAMPIAIYTLVGGNSGSNHLCKLEKFMVYFAIPLSCGILFLIALDRFLLIICLNRNLITPFRAKASILLLLVICLVAAIPQTLGFSTRTKMDVPHCHKFFCDFRICQPDDIYLPNKVVKNLQKSVIFAFLIIACLITIFYSMIFTKVYKMHKKMINYKPSTKKLKAINSTDTTSSSDLDQTISIGAAASPKNSNFDEVLTEEIALTNSDATRPTSQRMKENKKNLPHLKTAVTLFLVTASFILAYSPMSVMIVFDICERRKSYDGCLRNDYRKFLWQFYYLNHVTNPIIYSYLNPQFKNALRTFYKKYCCMSRLFCCQKKSSKTSATTVITTPTVLSA